MDLEEATRRLGTMVLVGSYRTYGAARTAVGKLADEMPVFLNGLKVPTWPPVESDLVGDVKVFVPEAHAQRALEILASIAPPIAADFAAKEPSVESPRDAAARRARRSALLGALLLVLAAGAFWIWLYVSV